jgi:hypothetical protein
MKCDYCNGSTDCIVSFPHPNGDIKTMCVACLDDMEEENMRAKGEPLKKGGRRDSLSKDL